MKFNVYCDSMYPYYGLSDYRSGNNDPALELTKEEYEYYVSVRSEWEQWQKKLGKCHE